MIRPNCKLLFTQCKHIDGKWKLRPNRLHHQRELVKVGEEYPQIKVLNLNVSFKEQYEKNGYNSASYALNVWQNQRDKYEQVHELLVKKPGAHDARSLKQIAQKTGTEAQLVDDKETKALLDKNYQYFTQLGLRGTPARVDH